MARVPSQYANAIARYGPSVNKLARSKYGISGQQLLAKLTQGESGFRMGAVSSAGARGATQFMPATRAEYIKKFGVDPWKNPDQAEHATALYLKGAGNVGAYNPGSKSYTSYVLGQKVSGLGSGSSLPSRSGSAGPPGSRTIPGVSRQSDRLAALQDYLLNQSSHDTQGTALLGTLQEIKGLRDTPGRTVRVKAHTRSVSGSQASPSGAGGTVMFDGKPVAPWIAKRLQRARAAGWTGKVSSGYRSDAEQTRIYKSGVRPAAVPRSLGGSGSNHEYVAFPGGAVDVTNAAQLASVLRKLGIRKLVYAGAKDPVHFSHPHGGSY